MNDHTHDNTSLWAATTVPARHPSLAFNVRVDVCVIGAGITGVTAAYLLHQAGRTVALVDRSRVGGGETGRSTAHITAVTDTPLTELIRTLGRDRAEAVWKAGLAGLARIRANVRDERIRCHFGWVHGYLHGAFDRDRARSREDMSAEYDAAASLHIDADLVDDVPGIGRPGVVFAGQARFDPVAYLRVLADRVVDRGSYVFEDTEIEEIEGADPVVVHSGPYRIVARDIIVATHIPLASAAGRVREALLERDVLPFNTYAVGGTIRQTSLDEGLYWEHTGTSYEYLRVDRHDTYDEVVFGGSDHHRPSAGTEDRFAALERRLAARIPGVAVTHRWQGQVLETSDGLPFVGEAAPGRFAATGYSGNGMTFGTVGGMMMADAILGRANPWRELFDINRTGALDRAAEPVVSKMSHVAPAGARRLPASPGHDVPGGDVELLVAQTVGQIESDRAVAAG